MSWTQRSSLIAALALVAGAVTAEPADTTAYERAAAALPERAPFQPCAYAPVRDLEIGTSPGVVPFQVQHCATEQAGVAVSYYRVRNHPENDFPVRLRFCPGGDAPMNREVRGGRRDGELWTLDLASGLTPTTPPPCTFTLAPAGHPRSSFEMRVWAASDQPQRQLAPATADTDGAWIRELGDVFAVVGMAHSVKR